MIKVTFEGELADWWGISDLLEDTQVWTDDEIQQAILDLMNEDIGAVLEGGTWRIEIIDEPNYQPTAGVGRLTGE